MLEPVFQSISNDGNHSGSEKGDQSKEEDLKTVIDLKNF